MIFVFGAVAVDVLALRERFVRGTSNPAEIRLTVGGVGYRIFRYLGCRKRFVGAVGRDALGRWLEERLSGEEGVRLLLLPAYPTACYCAFLESGELLYAASDMRISEHLRWELLQEELDKVVEGDFLVLEANLSPGLVEDLIARLGSGIRIVFEAVSVEKLLRHWTGLKDLFLLSCNEDEFNALFSEAGSADLGKWMRSRRIARILVTRGPEGLTLYSLDRFAVLVAAPSEREAAPSEREAALHTIDFNPGRRVEEEDTTGAGDRLLSELLSRLAEGQDVEKALPPAMREVERALKEGCL